MIKRSVRISFAALIVLSFLQSQATAQDISSSNWNVRANDSPQANAPSAKAILSLIATITRQETNAFDVCSYLFEDLDQDGKYELLASIDYSGRKFCNELMVVEKSEPKFVLEKVETWHADDMGNLVQDLKNDGRKELVVRQAWSDYNGAQCVALWSKIYRFERGKLIDVSISFPMFYRQRLNDLAKELSSNQSESVCTIMEIDKINRFLGLSPTAGFARAQQWKLSSDPKIRAKAIDVFKDIKDSGSRAELTRMRHDPNQIVSEKALLALENKTRN